MPRTFFHTAFIFLMNNAIFVIHSIIHSIVQQNYSFKEFIHSKKIQNYSFKDFIHSKKIQNNSFKKFIHSRKSKIIHSKKIFIQVKNGLSPMARWGRMSITNASNLLITQVLNALKQRLRAIMESKYRPYLAQTVCMCTFLD